MGAATRGLRVPGFYLLLLASIPAWGLAYQQKSAYVVDLGGKGDDAYVSGFHAKERNPQLDYRWSGPVSTVTFPGIGNQPVEVTLTTVGFRTEGEPPRISIEARGMRFEMATQNAPGSETFFLERGNPFEGDLELTISSPTFSPAGDPRGLGVIVDRVEVRPADYGLRPFVIPPVGTVAALLLGLGLLYLGALATLQRSTPALIVAAALSATATGLIVAARPELGLLARGLPALALWGVLVGLLGRVILDTLVGRGGRRAWTAGVGSAAFSVAFLLRFGGLVYPQFLTSDLGLHVNNVLSVLRGEWLFTEPLPDGTPVPYPNALYVTLALPSWLLGSAPDTIGLLLKWSGALLDAATCLGLAWAGWRIGSARAGALAALVYALSIPVFLLLSAGNYTNLFGQAVLNLTLLGGVVFLAQRERTAGVAGPALLALGFALTMLGHYGMMLATLAVAGIFALWVVWETVRGRQATRGWALLGACAAGVAASFALYYRHFVVEMADQWSRVLGRLGGTPAGGAAPAAQPPRPPLLGEVLRRAVAWIGVVPLLSAFFGSASAGRGTTGSRALLGAWLGASLLFALLDQIVGDAVRWYYLAAAPVSLLAGRYLSLLWVRARPARLLTGLVVTAMLFQLLAFWVGELIFSRYH